MSYNTRRTSNYGGMGGRGRPGMQPNYNSEKMPMRFPRPLNMPYQPMRQPLHHNPLPPPPLKSALKKEVRPPISSQSQSNMGTQQSFTQQSTVQQSVPTPVQKPKVEPQNISEIKVQQQTTLGIQKPKIESPNEQKPVQPSNPQQQQSQENLQQQLQQQQQQLPQENPQQEQKKEQLQQQQPPSPLPPDQKILQGLIVTELPPKPVPDQQQIQQNNVQNSELMDTDKKKNFFATKGKISKKEKRGRRNRRLRKLLVPKNALMVLHELVGSHKFNFLDSDPRDCYKDPSTYIASVTVEGMDHVGYGKSKVSAKTAAAETALKHIILSKMNATPPPSNVPSSSSLDSDGDFNMEVDERQDEDEVSWVHVASFAMHKLFSSWYGDVEERITQGLQNSLGLIPDGGIKLEENRQPLPHNIISHRPRKPAKQLPTNPEMLNPVMILNQMRDDVHFEDFLKVGTTPNIIFVIKATIDGEDFYGKGNNKKEARKNCAFAACTKIYGIHYPREEYDPTNSSIGVPIR